MVLQRTVQHLPQFRRFRAELCRFENRSGLTTNQTLAERAGCARKTMADWRTNRRVAHPQCMEQVSLRLQLDWEFIQFGRKPRLRFTRSNALDRCIAAHNAISGEVSKKARAAEDALLELARYFRSCHLPFEFIMQWDGDQPYAFYMTPETGFAQQVYAVRVRSDHDQLHYEIVQHNLLQEHEPFREVYGVLTQRNAAQTVRYLFQRAQEFQHHGRSVEAVSAELSDHLS